jgi:Na+/H+-dicarboxylate symporter
LLWQPPRAIEPVGEVWVSLLMMTVIPLLISLLITSIAAAGDPRRLGRIAGKALLTFMLLYLFVAITTTLIVPALFASSILPVQTLPSMRDATEAAQVERTTQAAPPTERIVGMIPTNPFAAAARGEILPLVIFAMLFGLALVHVRAEIRDAVVGFFQGVGEAMLVIVRWMLFLAPLGIFAVVLPLAARRGLAIIGALAVYVVLIAVLCLAFAVVFYALARFGGHVPIRRFARASAPAQSVALGTQSSLAALPTMLEAAESRLNIPQPRTSLVAEGVRQPRGASSSRCRPTCDGEVAADE